MPSETPPVIVSIARDLGAGGLSVGEAIAAALHAPQAWRIEQLARRYGIARDEARRRIERSDDARARYQRHYFDSDVYDSRQYDLVLNTESLGVDLAISVANSVAAAFAACEAGTRIA
jgi:cytidylate kinase